MSVSNKLTLKFDTAKGEVFSLAIQNANPNASEADVTQAMEDIISNNIFSSTAGSLASINSAELTKTETTDISVSI